MTENAGPDRPYALEQNAEALRQTRRGLDPDVARVADERSGSELGIIWGGQVRLVLGWGP
jgi:hypothetical protein